MAKILEIGNISFLYELNTRFCGHGSEEKCLAMVSLSLSLLLLQASSEAFELLNSSSLGCCWEHSFLSKEHFVNFLSFAVEEALVVFGVFLW